MDSALPPFSFSHTPEIPELLAQLNCSLVLSTYQAGKVIVLSSDGERLSQSPQSFDTPMGLAIDGERLAIAAKHEVIMLSNDPRHAVSHPSEADRYDGLFVPRSTDFCGRLNIHDIAFADRGIVGVNTAFSCLFRLDAEHNFHSIWKPPFITEYASEDRCHLNGMAMVDGEPRYVTALGDTDSSQGWREDKLTGGVLIDIANDEFIARGLAMPHSPRVYDGDLYLLLSSSGQLVKVDRDTGTCETVNKIDAFVRGMAKYGDYLFIGCSFLRKTHTFGDLPLAGENATFCGIAVIHFKTGAIVGQIKYLNSCEEIYDVQVIPNLRNPGILGTENATHEPALSIAGNSR